MTNDVSVELLDQVRRAIKLRERGDTSEYNSGFDAGLRAAEAVVVPILSRPSPTPSEDVVAEGRSQAEQPDPTNHTGEEVTACELRDAIMELAGGARIRLDDAGRPVLVRDLPQPSGFMEVLFHRGWLESMANGGTFRLSDEGLRAYLRSTDELGGGRLLHPHEWRN